MSRYVEWVAALGRWGVNLVRVMGRASLMLCVMLSRGGNRQGALFPLLVRQVYVVGVLSLLIIAVSGLFIGMVLGLQGYNILVRYGTEQAVGQMVALSLVRELGPVVTALLFAGRAGSALTAEIGLMKATDQLASLEMIGVDPLRQVAAPRFLAGVISMPLLACIFFHGRRSGWRPDRCRLAGHLRGLFLGQYGRGGQFLRRRARWPDKKCRLWRSGQLDCCISGL